MMTSRLASITDTGVAKRIQARIVVDTKDMCQNKSFSAMTSLPVLFDCLT